MIKKVLLALFLFAATYTFGQDTWKKTKQNVTDDVVFVASHMPSTFQLYRIDIEKINKDLEFVAFRDEINVKESTTILSFPTASGKFERFSIVENELLAPELAEKFPMIKTFIGQGIDDPTAILRLSLTTAGLHAMVLTGNKHTLFIDPYTKNRGKYIVYSKNNLPASNEFICDLVNTRVAATVNNDAFTRNAIDGKLRTYRLAIACTIEYSAYHLNNQGVSAAASLAVKKAAVLSAITNTVNRVGGIYEKETSVAFQLIANELSLIFINSDNFSNGAASDIVAAESQAVISSLIPLNNYDMGHTFARGSGGYAPGLICSNNKAENMTGITNPIGDAFDVDYVAHEFGHQFAAWHTFNGIGGNCYSGNANSYASSEAGSGTTIMAYAGTCAGINVQPNSDAYFHIKSLKQIYNKITSLGCATIVNTGNNEPVIASVQNSIIPKSTAFILEATANDADGDAMTYCWEQTDVNQAQHPLVSTSTQGPSYRSFMPTVSNKRFMPKFNTVLDGNLLLDNSNSIWEVTPSVGRLLNFALTVRDNNANGGQTKAANKQVYVSNNAGPFIVTSQATNESWNTGDNKIITWNVAGTTANAINTANVEILLVDNDGETLSILAASTANDGSQSITVPNTVSDNARIMVKAINNIYYAINAGQIAINSAPAGCTSLCPSAGSLQYGTRTTRVTFNTIDNHITGPKTEAYANFKAISTNVIQGNTYNLTVNVNTDGNFRVVTKVWIDWNKDCIFNTTDEEYDLGEGFNVADIATSNSPFSIQVPTNASLGATVMRVSSKFTNTAIYATPCQASFDGEVEDYTINIIATTAVEDLTAFDSFTLSPNPNNGNFTISLQSNTTNDIAISVFDVIGRQIYNKSFANNNTLFNANVSLSNLDAGVYLVSVTDGVKATITRILIK